MKWKRVIIQGNQQPRHGSMFSEHARLFGEREKCAMSHKRVRQVLGAAESNFLGVGGLLIYKLLDDEKSTSSDLDKYTPLVHA